MLLLCLSHSAALLGASQKSFAGWLESIGMVATPTFLLLSGIVCGYLATIETESVSRLRWLLVDRGLFLLIIGHLVLGLEHLAWAVPGTAISGSFYITDVVAIGLIVAALVTGRAAPRVLALVGIGMLLVAWVAANVIAPHNALERGVLRLLVGVLEFDPIDEGDEGYVVPLTPYLGMFLLGTAAGIEYVRRRAAGMTTVELATRCIRLGVVLMALAVAMKLVYLGLKPYLGNEVRQVAWMLTEPRQKLPPGAAYLFAFGGAGATMMGVIGLAARSAIGKRVVSTFAVVGRASFVIFVLQYLVYYLPARGFHVGVGSWGLVFPLSLPLLWGIAYEWDRFEGNRLFTVGLRQFRFRFAATPARSP